MRKLSKPLFILCAAATSTAALAGDGAPPVPGPEAGIGLAAMALIGAGYIYLKKRADRD